ncbi:MAG: hypothetical protein U0R76_10850 [Candidatus Nanopelagicales bacterium]
MSIWDDPELRSNDDFVSFENIGDTVSGRILTIRTHRFDDGKVVPQILLDTADGERTLTAGQVRLKAALAEQRPEAGDTLTVTLTQVEKRAGGKTLKHFDVKVTRGTATPAPAATAPPTTPVELTEEQKAGLRAMGIEVPA